MNEDNSVNKKLLFLAIIFLILYFTPFNNPTIQKSIYEAFFMLSEYAREHVLLCLIPAFFIAGAIYVFLRGEAVLRYLGPRAPKWIAYSIASVSGAILAVCSCTILPMFKGIYKKGAGLGPAVAFLYSGPAINVLAIILSAKVLGIGLATARTIGAISLAIIIGLIMQLIFQKEDNERLTDEKLFQSKTLHSPRPLWQDVAFVATLIGILIFLNWKSTQGTSIIWDFLYQIKWFILIFLFLFLTFALWKWFKKEDISEWIQASKDFGVQILPLLFVGVFLAGFFLGRPGHSALIPSEWITSIVGNNSLTSNILAAVSGALMYFATLTEVPILQGLMGAGMHKGPALALLLSGPSLSLPSLIVIWSVLGAKKTLTYLVLVVLLSAFAGMLYGLIV